MNRISVEEEAMVPGNSGNICTKERRRRPDRRGQGDERRARTDSKIRRLFEEFEFEDQRQGDRRSGKDRRRG